MNLWVRAGNADDYHDASSLDEVAAYLADRGVRKHLVRHGQYGASTRGFSGNNYISLYWGEDKEPEAVRDLNDEELAEVNRSLDYYFRN